MAAGTEVKSVWIGFMDIVPVIGTVKEAVELVLALYEGDKAVIKVKEKAVEDVVKESLKKPVKPTVRVGDFMELFMKPSNPKVDYLHLAAWSTRADKPAAAVSEFSGLKNVKEVTKEMIIECVGKGSKKGAKPTQAEQEKKQRRVDDVIKRMLEMIECIKPDYEFKEYLENLLKKSGRGEHVFNNNILRFHSDVLKNFIQSYNVHMLQGYSEQEIEELCTHTLPEDTATEIQYKMVAHFDEDEVYVNANGLVYGVYRQVLHEALLDVLGCIKTDDVKDEYRRRVNVVIDHMNNGKIYVDQIAKEKWITGRDKGKKKGEREKRFEKVRGEVVTMYSRDRGLNWCYDIMRKVAPWFGNRQ